jgi:hypothetical protein
VWSGGSNLAPGPLGSVAGDPDPRPAPGLAPLLLPRTGACRRGLRPRVFSAHRPGPQLQVHAPARAVTAHPLAARLQTGPAPLLQAIFKTWPGLLCRFRLALQRKSGPRIALPAHRLYYPVDIWPRSTTRGFCGDLRGACSVITQRARVQQRPSQRPPPFLHVPPRALWLECGPVEKKKRACPIPAESHVAVCMPAASKEAI